MAQVEIVNRSTMIDKLHAGLMLKPREKKEMVIVPGFKDDVALELIPQNVTFRISWRRCNATWLPQIPIYVWTSTTTIRKYSLETGRG